QVAISIGTEVSVESQPISWLGIQNSLKINIISLARTGEFQNARLHAGQAAEIGHQILEFLRAGTQRGHHRLLFLSDGGDLAFLKQMKPPLQILQAKVEIALAPDETTQVFPVPQL